MDGWDVTVLVFAGYLAVVALIRLMIAQREQVLRTMRGKAEAERSRQAAEAERKAEAERRKAA